MRRVIAIPVLLALFGPLSPPGLLVGSAAAGECPLQDLLDSLCGTNGLEMPGIPRSVEWTIGVRNKATGAITNVASANASYDVSVDPIFLGFVVQYTNVQHPGLNPDLGLEVEVEIKLTNELFVVSTRLDAALNGPAAASASIHSVRYPVVEVRAAPTDDLTWPIGTGFVFESVLTHPVVPLLSNFTRHPGPASMQWWCQYADPAAEWHPSFYMSTRDDEGVYKEYLLNRVPDAMRYTVRHVPPDNLVANSYEQPFSTAIGITADDWWAAANRYRKWAETQPWTSQGSMLEDPGFSPAIRDMTMFGVFAPDVDFNDWAPWPARHNEQAARFGTPRIVPQNYGWYDHGFDLRFGDWTPRADFTTIGPIMAQMGVAFSPYTLLHIFSVGSEPVVPGYDPSMLAQFAVIRENGTPETSIDLEGNLVYVLCQSTQFARDYAVQVANEVAALGASGVYMDVFNTLPPELCYSTTHGHVPADPENTRRRTDLVRAMRTSNSANPDFYLSSESVNEMVLGEMELGMSQWTRNVLGTAVTYFPLFETVYHPYQRIGRLGVALNYDTQKLPPLAAQLISRQTYAAHVFMGWTPFAGALLNPDTLADNEAASPIWGLFIDTVSRFMNFLTRDVIHEHVNFGRRLRDPDMQVATVDLSFFGPLLALLTVPYGPVQPIVYASAWGDPEDKTIVLLLANWTDAIDGTFTASMAAEPTISMTAADLGFDPKWFKEFDENMTCEVSAQCIEDLCSQSGCQQYSLSFRPADSGFSAKKWKIWHYPSATADPVLIGTIKGNETFHISGSVDSRMMEAFLLEPSP